MGKTDVMDMLERSAIWLQILHDMIDDADNKKELADLIGKLIYVSLSERRARYA